MPGVAEGFFGQQGCSHRPALHCCDRLRNQTCPLSIMEVRGGIFLSTQQVQTIAETVMSDVGFSMLGREYQSKRARGNTIFGVILFRLHLQAESLYRLAFRAALRCIDNLQSGLRQPSPLVEAVRARSSRLRLPPPQVQSAIAL